MADDIRLKVDILKARLAVADALEKAKKPKGKKGPGDQPRHPAGTSLGGQWKKGGSGASGGSQGAKKPSKGSGGASDKEGSPSWLKSWLDSFTGSSGLSGGGSMGAPGGSDWFGGMQQPKEPPYVKPASSRSVMHQEADDKGRPVYIQNPSKPSDHSTWTNPAAAATFVPGGDAPVALNGVAMKKWEGVDDWTQVPGQRPDLEKGMPDLSANKWKHPAAGVIIEEPDGRLWLTTPTNRYGGYRNTYPKGTQEKGLTLQQTAIKEAWEETGLQIEITGVLGDFERTTSVSRFYLAKRVGGTPTDQGWESQAIRLVPPAKVKSFLNMPVDRDIIDLLWEERDIYKDRETIDPAALEAVTARLEAIMKAGKKGAKGKGSKGGAWETQPRWPGGSPLGGQWKTYDSSGLVKPPSIGSKTNKSQQNKADAAYALAQGGPGNLAKIGQAMLEVEAKLKTPVSYSGGPGGEPVYGKKANSQDGWNQSLHQYLVGLVNSMGNAQKVEAKATKLGGPDKLGDYKKIGGKPGGSNPGGVYTDTLGNKVLVKGANTPSADRAKNEVLASKLMIAAGVAAPMMKLVDLGNAHGGGLGVASEMVDLGNWSKSSGQQMQLAQQQFAVHAWLANYDAVGQPVGDNLAMHKGNVFNFDPGGALLYRAQGKLKSSLTADGVLQPTVNEWQSMRNSNINPYAASVYGSMTDSQLKESAKLVAAVDNATIKALVDAHGPGDAAKKAALAESLIARKNDILAKVGLLPSETTATPLEKPGATMIDPAEKPDMVGEPATGAPVSGAKMVSDIGMTNKTGGHNKFYAMAVYDDGTLVKHWGAIGTKGQTKVEKFDTPLQAQEALTAQTQAKQKGGYSPDAAFYPADWPGYASHPGGTAKPAPKTDLGAADPFGTGATQEKTIANGIILNTAMGKLDPVEAKHFNGMVDQLKAAIKSNSDEETAALVNAVVKEATGIQASPVNSLGQAKAAILNYATAIAADLDVDIDAGSFTPAQKDGLPQASLDHMGAAKASAMTALDAHKVDVGSNLGSAFYNIAAAHDEMVAAGGNMSPGEVALFDSEIANAKSYIKTYGSNYDQQAVAAVDNYLSAVTGVASGTFVPKAEMGDAELTSALAAAHGLKKQPGGPPKAPDTPVFQTTSPGAVEYYNKLVAKMDTAFLVGDLKTLEGLVEKPNGKPAWPVKMNGEPKGVNAIAASTYHAGLVDMLKAEKAEATAETLKPATPVESGARKASGPAMPSFEKAKLPDSNTNASSHNKKIDAIKSLADGGDVKGILALNYGTNTYGKQQAKLANDVLASLGSDYTVDPGQKKNSHPALTGQPGSDTLTTQAKATAKLTQAELPPKTTFSFSSKSWVNEANQADYDALTNLALAGDMQGVKNYQFKEISKETGQPTGKMIPVSQHPSQHITGHQDFLLQQMDEKLNPPKPLEIFEAKMAADSVAAVAKKFKAAKLGTTSKQVPSTQKIGHFIALGQVSNPAKLTPAKKFQKNYSPTQVAQGHDDYKTIKKDANADKFRQLIQGHGGSEYHKGFDLASDYGKTRLAQAKAAHKYARKQPAGTTVYKWENLSSDTKAKLKTAQPGLIIQNPAPTCCSYSPTATKGFGSSHRWNIIYADGAKGFNSFGSGSYSSEKEVTMLPNHRFMILEHKPTTSNGWAETTVLLLPPDSLLDSDYWD